MKAVQIRPTSINEVIARAKEDEAIYQRLEPDERATVDAHNEKVRACNGNMRKIIALGRHPFADLRKKYGAK